MLAAFLLGLVGSLGHCVGMCGGVTLLLSRQGAARGPRLLLAHSGRITTYSLLGVVAGAAGSAIAPPLASGTAHDGMVGRALPGLSQWQGALAVVTAVLALYMGLALLGRVPSPELYFTRLTRWWGRAMRHLTQRESTGADESALVVVFASGLLWGLLPCGLVMAALLAAAVSGSSARGALTMLVFGLGTWPVNLSVGLVAQRPFLRQSRWRPYLRLAAFVVVLLFSLQMGLRGFAAWGWVDHGRLGGVVLW